MKIKSTIIISLMFFSISFNFALILFLIQTTNQYNNLVDDYNQLLNLTNQYDNYSNTLLKYTQKLELYSEDLNFKLNYSEWRAKKILSNCQSWEMYNVTPGQGIGGLYFSGKGYCVWTYENDEWIKDETHEKCHNLIWLNYSHFCQKDFS